MNRFDLEEAITEAFTANEELETLLYRIGDSPVEPSEDEIMNILIGIIALNKVRYEKLWNTFEALIKNGTITNKGIDKIDLPDYDDGTMAMKTITEEGEIK
jgi:hypothetical protein